MIPSGVHVYRVRKTLSSQVLGEMRRFPRVSEISPRDFESQVKEWLKSVSESVESFSATHLEKLSGVDGEYEIDVVARFRALGGASFLVLVERKKHSNPVDIDRYLP